MIKDIIKKAILPAVCSSVFCLGLFAAAVGSGGGAGGQARGGSVYGADPGSNVGHYDTREDYSGGYNNYGGYGGYGGYYPYGGPGFPQGDSTMDPNDIQNDQMYQNQLKSMRQGY